MNRLAVSRAVLFTAIYLLAAYGWSVDIWRLIALIPCVMGLYLLGYYEGGMSVAVTSPSRHQERQ